MGEGADGGTARLFGRDAELASLNDALDRVRAGAGSVALISGEPGIGKSTLCAEVARRATSAQMAVRWGRCAEVEGAPPFWPWRQVLGRWPEHEPDADRFSFLDEVARAILAAAAETGLVVLLEDLHWADDDSLMLLSHLGRQLDAHPALVVATYRPEEARRDGPLERAVAGLVTHALDLPLGRLADEAVAGLLDTIAPDIPAAARTEVIAERADGNPFYVTQLARAWGDGTTTPDRSVPHGVGALVRLRLGGLDPSHLEVLRTAAVLGRTFDIRTVTEIAGDSARAAIAVATERNLVVSADAPGEARFVHALVREVLEEDMDGPTRAGVHRAVVDHLEATAPDAPHVLAALAGHALAAAPDMAADRVVEHVRRGARAAFESGGAHEAIRLCRRGLDLEPAPPTRVELQVLLGRALFVVDELRESERTLLAAAEEAHRLGDHVAAARALLEIGSGRLVWRFDPTLADRLDAARNRLPASEVALRAVLRSRYADFVDDPAEVEEACRDAFEAARDTHDPEAIVQTGVRLLLNGCAWMLQEERREALRALEAAVREGAPRELVFNVAALRARMLLEDGLLDEAVTEARYTDEVFGKLTVVLHSGDATETVVAVARGRIRDAEALHASIVAEVRRRNAVAVLAPTMAARGSAIARERDAGRSNLARMHALRTEGHAAQGAVTASEGFDIACALVLAETGDVDAARDLISDVMEADLERIAKGWGGNQLAMVCLLVQAAHHVRCVDVADRLLAIVRAVADRNVVQGMPPTFMLGHGAHFTGLCHHLAGRLDDAVSHLETARAANRAMRAVGPLVRTQLALASVLADRGDGAGALDQLRQARRSLEGTELDDLRRRVDRDLDLLSPGGGDGGPAGTTTFVFTDIVDSTAQTRAAGDRAWRERLEDHSSLVRALALRHGGRVVKGLGDGYMLTFTSARAAVDFGRSLQTDGRTTSLGVRVGVHTGEAEQVGDDHIGHHVNLAARVAGAAAAGEVLVSETAHAVVSSAGDLRFEPARVARLKGIGEVAVRALRLDP